MVSPIPRRKRTGQHARRAAPAEIGLERRIERGARRQRGERRRREARGLAQVFGFARGEGTRSDPSQPWAVLGQPDNVFMHGVAREPCKPAPAVDGRTVRRNRGMRSGHESQGLDHIIALGSPQPGASRNQRVGRSQRQRPAGERRAIRDEAASEGRQKKLGGRRNRRRIDQPGEGCREGHGLIIGWTRLNCHQRFGQGRSAFGLRRPTSFNQMVDLWSSPPHIWANRPAACRFDGGPPVIG